MDPQMDMADGNRPPDPGSADMGEDQGNGIIHIPGDMLPEEIRGKCKAGDKLTFEVVGPPDEEGDVPVEFESGTGYPEQDDESQEPWEDEFRKAMSPRSESESPPTVPQDEEQEGMGY